MQDNGFLGIFGLSDGSGWILPPNLLSDNLIADDYITQDSSWRVLTDGVQLQYGMADIKGNAKAIRATLNDTNPNHISYSLAEPLDSGATYRLVIEVRSRYYNFDAKFQVSYNDGDSSLKAKEYNLSYLWRTRTYNFTATNATVPEIRLTGTNNSTGINEFEVGKIQLYKIVEAPDTGGGNDDNDDDDGGSIPTPTNLMPEPYVNAIDGGWEDVSSGSYQVTGVNDMNGDPVATEVFLQTSQDHHVYYELPEPLIGGEKYNIEIELVPGSKGYSGEFEFAYYDGDNQLVVIPTYIAPGWHNVVFSFIAENAPQNTPEIRLIGWDSGNADDSIIIGYVNLYEYNESVETELLPPQGDAIVDMVNYPMTPAHFFNVTAPEDRTGAQLIFNQNPTAGQTFTDYVDNTLQSTLSYNEANSSIETDSTIAVPFLRTTCLAGVGGTDGGTGWENRFMSEESACFEYKVRFQPGMEWVKGGKLPGLYGGDSPSGGSDSLNGFSTRMMWRRDADGEAYVYAINKMMDNGAQVGTGMFKFTDGEWHTLKQEVILNTIGPNGEVYADGRYRQWFNGEPIFEVDQIIYRQSSAVTIDGIMYTIFFGGSDDTWAPSQDMAIDTAEYKIWAPVV